MNTEPVTSRCPKCQAPLPANAPQGLCPKCLLAAAAAPTEAGPTVEKDPPPPIGTIAAAFPHLEIIELIGQGGMGLVYKARQPKLDRFVALKLLPQSLAADPAFAERFNREARVLARLNHPNIVTVHDFGQAGGFFFLLMEFVDGVNLRQAMHAARFTPQQAMLLVPRICEALQFAHDEGVLHRDIKPENILLDTRGRVKIADFGIAKLVGEAREQLALTASGLAVGTPHYMAPEQLEHPHDVDQRADIYSLGVVFYEMLTGELPIGRFAPPSTKTSVDQRVDEIVFHALEKEREKRFRTATEVKTSVEAITTGSVPRPNPYAAPAAASAHAAASAPPSHATCYFNTPQRMSDCFPSAAARIFTCKGELALEPDALTFTNQWRTTIRIPLQDIEDLTIGQFQMWTTPWVMKYARVDFLSVCFRNEGRLQTVHLTPVPPDATSVGQINLCVGLWFDWLQRAVRQCTGALPHASDPATVSIGGEPAWNRRGLPLVVAWVLTSIAAWMLMPQPRVPRAVWLPAFTISIILLIGMLWFVFGFLQANRALWRANLDAVTSDEPLPADPAAPAPLARTSRRTMRFVNVSFFAAVFLGLAGPIAFLLWEASLFPLFGEKIFGPRFSSRASSQLVLDAVPPLYSPDSSDPRQHGGGAWKFNCLVPPDSLARIWFVRWTNHQPTIEPGLSVYFKSGHAPGGVDFFISCEPHLPAADPVEARMMEMRAKEPGQPTAEFTATNLLQWNVNLGLGYTAATLLPAERPFRIGDTPARMTVGSGHQRVIRLVDSGDDRGARVSSRDGVEVRILLEPLTGPPIRTVPSEKQVGDLIAGRGLDVGMEQALKLIRRMSVDQ